MGTAAVGLTALAAGPAARAAEVQSFALRSPDGRLQATLGAGRFEAMLYVDGLNADKGGTDYRRESREVDAQTRLALTLKPGGGAVVRLRPLAH